VAARHLDELSTGDRVIGISGILLFVVSFFTWFGYGGPEKAVLESAGFDTAQSAWGYTLTLLAVLLGLVMVVIVALKLFDVSLADPGDVPWGLILVGMGALAFLFVLIQFISDAEGEQGLDFDRKIGVYVGLVASVGLAVGACLRMQENSRGTTAAPPPDPPPA